MGGLGVGVVVGWARAWTGVGVVGMGTGGAVMCVCVVGMGRLFFLIYAKFNNVLGTGDRQDLIYVKGGDSCSN